MKAEATSADARPANRETRAFGWRPEAAVALVYLLVVGWLAMRGRVFMDEIWILDAGRVLLHPDAGYSMYMHPDGSSLLPLAKLGPALAELLFQWQGSVWPIRLVNALGMLLMAWACLLYAQRHAVPATLARLIVLALLLDPTMLQSVVLGRQDGLGLALALGGLGLADAGVARVHTAGKGWLWIAIGYAGCALAPSAWTSGVMLGPLVLVHWIASIRVLGAVPGGRPRVLASTVVAPLLAFAAAIDPVSVLDAVRANAESPLFASTTGAGAWGRVPELLAVSLWLVVPGAWALLTLRPRWLALWLAGGCLLVLSSGIHPFRIPFVLAYLVAAMLVVWSHPGQPRQARLWQTYFSAVAAVLVLLLLVRSAFGLVNEPRIDPARTWLAQRPAETTVADFSWDFYESARVLGLRVMRPMPGIERSQVRAWLDRFRPDVVVRAVDARGSFVLVEDLDGLLAEGGYCPGEWIDWTGAPVSRDMRPRSVPTGLLWRLGLFRDHGPYALWLPCG